MNELIEGLNALRGKSKPTWFNCTFAVTNVGDVVVISHDAPEGLVDDYDPFIEGLGSNLTDKPGAYKGVVEVQTFTCNHPEDPTEWDINFTLISFEELVFTELQIRKAVLEALKSSADLVRSIGPEDANIEVFGAKVCKLQNQIIDSL